MKNALDQKFSDYSAFQVHPMQLVSKLRYTQTPSVDLFLNVGDETIQLTLHPDRIFSEGAKLVFSDDSGTQELYDLESDDVWRGFVNGDSTQRAAFIINNAAFSGYYFLQGQSWSIAPVSQHATGLLSPSQARTQFIKYIPNSTGINPVPPGHVECATPVGFDDPILDPTVIERGSCPLFFELAYDVDYDTWISYYNMTKLNSSTRKMDAITLVRDFFLEVTMEVEQTYQSALNLTFSITVVNIHENAGYPFTQGSQSSALWSNSRNWWINNMGCYTQDAVSAVIGFPFGANGYVAGNGVNSICGAPLTTSCISQPHNIVRWDGDNADRLAGRVAHELGHNFGLFHSLDCTIMDNTCPTRTQSFNMAGQNHLMRRCDPNDQVCKSSVNYQSGYCLEDAAPVDLYFKLSLQPEDVVLLDSTSYCFNETFLATFYNNFNPNLAIVWELGPGLAYTPVQPAGNLKRKLIVTDPNANPHETWIRVSFSYNCGNVVYERKVKIGNSFGLEGIYQAPQDTAWNDVYTTQSGPEGSYVVHLENPTAVYNWSETFTTSSGTATYPLSGTTATLYFYLPSQKSRTFNVSTTGECGPMSRTFTFYNYSWSMAGPKKGGTTAIQPNPTTGILDFSIGKLLGDDAVIQQIDIFDALGKMVFSKKIEPASTSQIDVSMLQNGAFLAQVLTSKGAETLRFIKL